MTLSLQHILAELYEIDPGLKDHEKELIPVIKRLLKDQPDAEPTEQFIAELRAQLQSHARALKNNPNPNPNPSPIYSFFSTMKYSYALVGVVLGVVITAPAMYYAINGYTGPGALNTEDDHSLFSYSITKRPDNAFGDLSSANLNTAMAYGRGGGGGGGAPEVDSKIAAGSNPVSDTMIYPPGEFLQYDYEFTGTLPDLTAEKVSVLKRQKNMTRIDLNAIKGSFDLGAINMNAFDGARVDSLTFTQDVPYGYMVSVQLSEGSIGVSQNWQKWPHPESNCKDDACWRSMQLKPGDIPSDEVILNAANSFVEKYGIDLTNYGTPEVDRQWMRDYERATDKSMAYVPEVQRVIYPLLIEGEPVYDEGGNKAGIQVGVHAREKKVSEMWGLVNNNYLRSDYAAVTDANAVTTFLNNFEKTPAEYLPTDAKIRTIKIQLGTPVVAYTRMYMYDNDTNDELLVPSLVFPVENVPNGEYFYRTAITVPLAKDILARIENRGQPMPLAEPGVIDPAASTTAPDSTESGSSASEEVALPEETAVQE